VWGGKFIGESESQGESGQVLDSGLEELGDGFRGDTGLSWGEDVSIIIDVEEFHSILERLDVQLLQEGGLGGHDDLSGDADYDLVDDFDLSLLDLSCDLKSVEEPDLGWVQSGRAWRDRYVDGSDGTGSGHGVHLVRLYHSLQLVNGGVGENQTNLVLHYVG
jgi:hypothetical protein